MSLLIENAPLAETIGSLEELVQVLHRATRPSGYTDALLRFRPSPTDLDSFLSWNSRHYTRQPIHRTQEHELLLICYEPGQRTSIHDYDSQLAWIKPLLGSVREEQFKATANGKLRLHSERTIGVGTLSYLQARNCIHRHSNAGPGRAITPNLYSRPLLRWRVYDEHTGQASLAGTVTGTEE